MTAPASCKSVPITCETSECMAFRKEGQYIAAWMRAQAEVKEESITDLYLFRIARSIPTVRYKSFTRWDEARKYGPTKVVGSAQAAGNIGRRRQPPRRWRHSRKSTAIASLADLWRPPGAAKSDPQVVPNRGNPAPNRSIDIHIGSRNPDLEELLNTLRLREWAYITAWNPRSKERSAEENAAAHRAFLQELHARGFRHYFEGEGIPDNPGWAPERSVWIAGISRADAIALGAQCGQNAIVVGQLGGVAELVFCPLAGT